VRHAVELPDVHHVVLVAQDGSLVVVGIKIVGGREEGDHAREALGTLAVHLVARVLGLVRADEREEIVPVEELDHGTVTVHIRAAAHFVVLEEIFHIGTKVFHRVSPEQVADTA
jgi:hypothetical protein